MTVNLELLRLARWAAAAGVTGKRVNQRFDLPDGRHIMVRERTWWHTSNVRLKVDLAPLYVDRRYTMHLRVGDSFKPHTVVEAVGPDVARQVLDQLAYLGVTPDLAQFAVNADRQLQLPGQLPERSSVVTERGELLHRPGFSDGEGRNWYAVGAAEGITWEQVCALGPHIRMVRYGKRCRPDIEPPIGAMVTWEHGVVFHHRPDGWYASGAGGQTFDWSSICSEDSRAWWLSPYGAYLTVGARAMFETSDGRYMPATIVRMDNWQGGIADDGEGRRIFAADNVVTMMPVFPDRQLVVVP